MSILGEQEGEGLEVGDEVVFDEEDLSTLHRGLWERYPEEWVALGILEATSRNAVEAQLLSHSLSTAVALHLAHQWRNRHGVAIRLVNTEFGAPAKAWRRNYRKESR